MSLDFTSSNAHFTGIAVLMSEVGIYILVAHSLSCLITETSKHTLTIIYDFSNMYICQGLYSINKNVFSEVT